MTPLHTPRSSVRSPVRNAVRNALIDLLTSTLHDAATPATLSRVGITRRALTQRHPARTSLDACPEDRHAALGAALGDISRTLLSTNPGHAPDPTHLQHYLTDLAAIALAWLDALPDPDNESQDDSPEPEPEAF